MQEKIYKQKEVAKMNKVVLIGNLTKAPELTTTTNGVAVCKFTVAVGRRFANADGEKETDFINCVCWRAVAENCGKYLTKGSKVCVVGAMQTRTYDAQDGTKRYITEVMADEVEFLTPKTQGAEQGKASEDLAPIDEIDDLPF